MNSFHLVCCDYCYWHCYGLIATPAHSFVTGVRDFTYFNILSSANFKYHCGVMKVFG